MLGLYIFTQCGMRHPNTGLSDDDLSRLTGSSSSNSSSSSSDSSNPSSPSSSLTGHHHHHNHHAAQKHFGSEDAAHQQDTERIISPKLLQSGEDNEKTATTTQGDESPAPNKSTTNNNNNQNEKNVNQQQQQQRFNSTYLPEFINPLEWQKSRKRKERLDSSSSTTQDRKLQRSNSEELQGDTTNDDAKGGVGARNGVSAIASQKGADAMRRVSSEDFKKTTSYAAYIKELNEDDATLPARDHGAHDGSGQQPVAAKEPPPHCDENDAALANRCQPYHHLDDPQPAVKDMTRRTRSETSPMRSHRLSPIRSHNGSGVGGANGRHSDSNDSECEHERRRSSERFCKSRLPPGRKASGISKKTSGSNSSAAGKYLTSRRDENAYKYDLSALKHERRGFVSKKMTANAAVVAPPLPSAGHDLNDNNLIDFHQQHLQPQPHQPHHHHHHHHSNQPQLHQQIKSRPSVSPTFSSGTSGDETEAVVSAIAAEPKLPLETSGGESGDSVGSRTVSPQPQAATPSAEAPPKPSKTPKAAAREDLPWNCSLPEDQAPVLSRRYATVRHPIDNLDTAAKLSKVMPYPQQYHKQTTTAQRLAAAEDGMDGIEPYRAFTSLENLRTRDVMLQVIPAMMSFQTPEERLKQVNKRVTALKKKLVQLEENYESRMGYRPSQAERLNDKYMKNVIAELAKLRKEKYELKSEPLVARGLKVVGGMDASKKQEKMRATLQEIGENLGDKRLDAHRSEVLDDLTADQLVQEKTAVQHALLYFESLYGRPITKEERDAARPLYDRYRMLKRMVTRSVLHSGCAAVGAPELPTIHEHEAMVFEFTPQQYSSNNSTDTTNSPTDSAAPTASSDESAATTTTTASNTTTGGGAEGSENVQNLGLDQLWELLNRTREEKKLLKRTIRDFETVFEEQNGRKMLKHDRKTIEETYAQYKEKKAKTRLLEALIRKHNMR